MDLNKIVVAERNKKSIVLLFVFSGIFFLLFLVTLLGSDLNSLSNDELAGILIFGFLPLLLLLFAVIFTYVTPKNMIVFDKNTEEFELRCGKSLAEIRKPIYISAHDIESISYDKFRMRYYVILTAFRSSYINIQLKNGENYTVYDIAKPDEAEYNLQRILVYYIQPDEE